ncbi:MAG TPA: peptide chain release factor N(5)-glutamine methyltransferase [Gammaproteobacteria bacterium]|nr:peptide chain release factor N(5)-glutamine methyltransferase [Gammaproteobacteria bacterium]
MENLLNHATTQLAQHDQPRLDAEVLLSYVLGKPRSHLHAWPEKELDATQAADFLALVEQRVTGHPVAHLTGRREFWSLELDVSDVTLIPRPETELLVEQALALLPAHEALQVADLGTGSGAIAIALAHERRRWQLLAIDRSINCTRIARGNAQRLDVTNLNCINANWSTALADNSLHAIVSNPPYVAMSDPHLRRGDVRFEPLIALVAGTDGLEAFRSLLGEAPRVLKNGGRIFLEHGMEQAEDVRNLLKKHGFTDIETCRDLAGLERVSQARKPA